MLSFSMDPSSWPQGELAFPHQVLFRGERRTLHGCSVERALFAGTREVKYIFSSPSLSASNSKDRQPRLRFISAYLQWCPTWHRLCRIRDVHRLQDWLSGAPIKGQNANSGSMRHALRSAWAQSSNIHKDGVILWCFSLFMVQTVIISVVFPPSHLHEALQRRTHIPLLFCRGSEGLPLCLLDLSPRSWTQRFLHSKCCRCHPAGINCRHVQRINGSTALTGLVKERKAYRSLNKSRNKSTFKKHWKHWVWLLWAKPHERLYNALQAYKVEGLVHPNNKEKKIPSKLLLPPL